MDLKIFEQWFLSIMPEKYHSQLHPLIVAIKEGPHQQFAAGLPLIWQHLSNGTDEERAGTINGLLMGLALCESYRRNPEQVRAGMQLAIDHNAKVRGENIVSFAEERAKKR